MHLRLVTLESYTFRMLLTRTDYRRWQICYPAHHWRVPCSILAPQDWLWWLRVFVVFSSFQANAATVSQNYATTAFCTHLPTLNRRVTYSVLNVSFDRHAVRNKPDTSQLFVDFSSLSITNVRMVIYEQCKTCIISYPTFIMEGL